VISANRPWLSDSRPPRRERSCGQRSDVGRDANAADYLSPRKVCRVALVWLCRVEAVIRFGWQSMPGASTDPANRADQWTYSPARWTSMSSGLSLI
jgi:hypothetical protein